MAGAAHPNAARLFVDHVLSKQGQELLRDLGKIPRATTSRPEPISTGTRSASLPAEEEAKTTHYGTVFDDLFVKSRK